MEFILTVCEGFNDNKMIVMYLIHSYCDYRMRKLKKLPEHELRRSKQQIAQNSSILISSSIKLDMSMMMLFVPMIQCNMNDQFHLYLFYVLYVQCETNFYQRKTPQYLNSQPLHTTSTKYSLPPKLDTMNRS
mmetsp:Transcript_15007/g.17766  ORF Transcript_15007/g.17766 Transcript_15007/m.17766 type:complete len:132 (-) Transcript_15007:32-427(-)